MKREHAQTVGGLRGSFPPLQQRQEMNDPRQGRDMATLLNCGEVSQLLISKGEMLFHREVRVQLPHLLEEV
jgi:hypothetical protein